MKTTTTMNHRQRPRGIDTGNEWAAMGRTDFVAAAVAVEPLAGPSLGCVAPGNGGGCEQA